MPSATNLRRFSVVALLVLAVTVVPTAIASANSTTADSTLEASQSAVPDEANPVAHAGSATDTARFGGGDLHGPEPAGPTNPTVAGFTGTALGDGAGWNLGGDAFDSASPVTTSGVVDGFVLGVVVSTSLTFGWQRAGRLLESVPFVGHSIQSLATAVERSGSDSDMSQDEDATSPEAESGPDTITDDELLPNEVRVQQLLEDENGRAKQGTIVERTAWSKAKVSRVLSTMAEDGKVTKIMLGRENLICLPGHEPTLANRPAWSQG